MIERRFRSLYIGAAAVIGVGLLGMVLVPKAHADTWDKKAIVTVNNPIIVGDYSRKLVAQSASVQKLFDHKKTEAEPFSVPPPQAEPPQTVWEHFAPAVRSLPHIASSSALTGLVGLGFLSLSGIISLFTRKGA